MLDDLYSQETEQNILGIMLVDDNKALFISYLIDTSDFYTKQHRLIYECIINLLKQGKATDIVSVSEKLKFDNQLDKVGGREYINSLADNVITLSNYKQLCKIIIKEENVDERSNSQKSSIKNSESEKETDIFFP